MSVQGKPAYGLTDDAAVLSPPPEKDLVITKDALVAGVHFFDNDPVDLIARKALRVNLSDLAAMGAEPLGYLLALAIPKAMPNLDSWIETFTEGLKKDQSEFGWSLMGGDTVSTPGPLTISVTAIGTVTPGRALRRLGAQAGDDIYVSGTLGDSALGLKCLTGDINPENKKLIEIYQLPQPRLALGQKLSGIATAVMDVSDGLAGDIRHICALSGLGAAIEAELIPISSEVEKVLERFGTYKSLIWTGGDVYELLFTAPGHEADAIRKLSKDLELPITKIGTMTKQQSIAILSKSGINLIQNDQGFRHF